jgi:hypothetical protein
MPSETTFFDALNDKANLVAMQAEKMFALAYHYYLNNGRGAVLMNFADMKQLVSVADTTAVQYIPYECAAEFDKEETLHLIRDYNPHSQFVLLLCVASTGQNQTLAPVGPPCDTTVHIHVTMIDQRPDTPSGPERTPIFIKRSNSRIRFN